MQSELLGSAGEQAQPSRLFPGEFVPCKVDPDAGNVEGVTVDDKRDYA